MAVPARKDTATTLVDIIDRILDKGLVINADLVVSVAGVELLGIKIRAAVASLETAARYGLEMPGGTNHQTAAWQEAQVERETCPQCDKRVPVAELLNESCPWCGWKSARARSRERQAPQVVPLEGGRMEGGR